MKFAGVRLMFLALLLAALAILAMGPVSGQDKLPLDDGVAVPKTTDRFAPAGGWGAPQNAIGPAATKLHTEELRLEEEARSLVNQYAGSREEGQQANIRSKLSDVLEKQFDLQQKRRDLEVAQLEAQLKKVRELMRKRANARQMIVEKRLDQLLREAEGLGWTAPPAGAAQTTPGRGLDLLPELSRQPVR